MATATRKSESTLGATQSRRSHDSFSLPLPEVPGGELCILSRRPPANTMSTAWRQHFSHVFVVCSLGARR
jgi:hypothetical protein